MATFDDKWIPQFPDGSGWDLDDKKAPYFYEHITPQERRKQEAVRAKQLYKIVGIDRHGEQAHKNTFFVKGRYLEQFLTFYWEWHESIVSIEPVEHMPSTDEKLA